LVIHDDDFGSSRLATRHHIGCWRDVELSADRQNQVGLFGRCDRGGDDARDERFAKQNDIALHQSPTLQTFRVSFTCVNSFNVSSTGKRSPQPIQRVYCHVP
jgi:hypothetical protein